MLWELDGYNYKTRVIGGKSRNQWVIADDFWDYQSVDPTGTTINKEIEIDLKNVSAPLSEKLTNFKLFGQIKNGKFKSFMDFFIIGKVMKVI